MADDAKESALRVAAVQAETALGEGLAWLAEHFDLEIRQKDAETLHKLGQMQAAWKALAKALKPVTD